MRARWAARRSRIEGGAALLPPPPAVATVGEEGGEVEVHFLPGGCWVSTARLPGGGLAVTVGSLPVPADSEENGGDNPEACEGELWTGELKELSRFYGAAGALESVQLRCVGPAGAVEE